MIAKQLEAAYPDTNSGNGATANLLYEVLVRQARPALVVLIGAVVAMLLIACVNIANLLLVRGTARAQELEVRRALGAERWRLLRQLLTESVLLALVGGAAGVVLAYAGFGLFVALLPADQARVHMVEINGRVLMFAAAASIIAGLLFGLVPALQAGSSRTMALLRAARVAGAGGGRGTDPAVAAGRGAFAGARAAGRRGVDGAHDAEPVLGRSRLRVRTVAVGADSRCRPPVTTPSNGGRFTTASRSAWPRFLA